MTTIASQTIYRSKQPNTIQHYLLPCADFRNPATTGFFQRAEEKLFGWYEVINEGRPYCLQDVHLVRTASQASITLSGYKERRRLAREVERREQQESGTHFKETCNLFEHIFDMWIILCKCQGNADDWSWDEVEWDEVEWDEVEWEKVEWDKEKQSEGKESEGKQDSCVEDVEHVEHPEDP
ncbi:uncharacterized protein EAF02_000435 [Botrytis sinoallii]|uniref:uncharacterized protein n=1 Tax=Botrytis sinoallii TaxID=1463999 RepID=UPI0019013467|nr:uncharacterized protein EAF02_000435 [Botrytis sinoallii]KAF7892897.1 hypothetical protein EAF02_000435 [Botrytis sinoallii]